jgi:hypothetical protein
VAREPAGALTLDDRAAIEDTVAAYALGLDADDVGSVLELFEPDAVFETFGREYVGRDRIGRMMASAPKGLHLTGRSMISPHPRGAEVRLQLMFVEAATREPRLALYDELLVRAEERWRFARIRVRFLDRYGALADRP